MATYKEKAICLAVLSVGVGAMFIASFALHALPAFANARSNNWTSMQPQGVQSTQRVQNTTANNYTGLEEKKTTHLPGTLGPIYYTCSHFWIFTYNC